MTKKTILAFLFLGFIQFGIAQKDQLEIFSKDKDVLLKNKMRVKKEDNALMPSYRKLIRDADQLLDAPLLTVMEKKQLPPSGDIHDYMSIAIYFWPDPSKPNGLPYIRRDGEINPEVADYKDKTNISLMMRNVEILSLAYFFSDDSKYANKTIQQIRAWFLDSATRMNPNFNFAQAIKGTNDGRGIGIIESRNFIQVLDAVGFIKSNPNWTKKDDEGMQKWGNDFLSWLTTSPNGIDEMNTKNNHGIWYDAQKLAFALYTKNTEVALSTVKSVKQRLEKQMNDDGFFPLELERTTSLHYSAFILEPLFLIAHMSDKLNVDMWNYNSTTNKSLQKGFFALMPYLSKDKDWFGKQIKPFEFKDNASPLLAQGAYKYSCASCKNKVNDLLGKDAANSILHLTTIID